MKKNYEIELLFDNGVTETHPIGEMTEEQLIEFLNVPYTIFHGGHHGVLQVPGKNGDKTLINVHKVCRLSAKEILENN